MTTEYDQATNQSRARKFLILGAIATSHFALLAACSTAENGSSPPEQIVAYDMEAAADVAIAPEGEADAIVVSGSRTNYSYQDTPISVTAVQAATDPGRERYDGKEVSAVKLTGIEPVSTFSVDVDTGAYTNTRRFLNQGQLPPQAAVRTEEMINYFRYDYPRPADRSTPFSVTTDVARSPWNEGTYLMRIGLRGYDIDRDDRPPANLVFLMDVSGSMGAADKLPLVKTALSGLAGELGPNDTVSIVVYAGAAGLVLQPTNDVREIRRALDQLDAGGSTAGGAGSSWLITSPRTISSKAASTA